MSVFERKKYFLIDWFVSVTLQKVSTPRFVSTVACNSTWQKCHQIFPERISEHVDISKLFAQTIGNSVSKIDSVQLQWWMRDAPCVIVTVRVTPPYLRTYVCTWVAFVNVQTEKRAATNLVRTEGAFFVSAEYKFTRILCLVHLVIWSRTPTHREKRFAKLNFCRSASAIGHREKSFMTIPKSIATFPVAPSAYL